MERGEWKVLFSELGSDWHREGNDEFVIHNDDDNDDDAAVTHYYNKV